MAVTTHLALGNTPKHDCVNEHNGKELHNFRTKNYFYDCQSYMHVRIVSCGAWESFSHRFQCAVHNQNTRYVSKHRYRIGNESRQTEQKLTLGAKKICFTGQPIRRCIFTFAQKKSQISLRKGRN